MKKERQSEAYRLSFVISRFSTNDWFPDDVSVVLIKGALPEELLDVISNKEKEELSVLFCQSLPSPCSPCADFKLKNCAVQFQVHCDISELAKIFASDLRFVAEVLSKKENKESVIGIASTTLSSLLKEKCLERRLSVFSIKSKSESSKEEARREVGDIFFKASIERFSDEPSSCKFSEEKHAENENQINIEQVELELLKRSELEEFQRRLTQAELERLTFLETEWNKHEKQRDIDFAKAKEELQATKQNLKAMVIRVEERERKLVSLQESLNRRRRDLERQHTTKVQEAEDTIKRLQREFEQHLSIEKDNSIETITKSNQLKQQLKASSEKVKELEETVSDLRKTSVESDVLVLRKELENYQKLAKDAQERIEVLETEKNSYKSRIVDLARSLAEAQAEKNTPDLKRMTAQETSPPEVLTTSAIMPAQNMAEDVDALRKQLEELQQQVQPKQEETTEKDARGVIYDVETIDVDKVKNEELKQILINRQELLQTGVYTKTDDLIRDLEQRILQLLTSKPI